MKKILFTLLLLLFVIGCNLTAYPPTATQTSGNPAQTPAYSETSTPEIPPLTLDDFPDKVFVGENDNYSVYIINNTSDSENTGIGDILVFDKAASRVIPITGPFNVLLGGGTLVYDDVQGEYLLLSVGTYVTRQAIVLSLTEERQAVPGFCMTAGTTPGFLFWNHYALINNCDTFDNRPWGAGEAPSIVAIDLESGMQTAIANSDRTHQYDLERIDGNTLTYKATYVNDEADWSTPSLQISEERTYDLSLLDT